MSADRQGTPVVILLVWFLDLRLCHLPYNVFLQPQDTLRKSAISIHLQLPVAVAECVRGHWRQHPARPIICSDFSTLFILHPPALSKKRDAVFESISLDSGCVALRIAIAACVHAALPANTMAKPFRFNRPLPLGCIIDPAKQMDPDNKVFQTCRHHADFDYFTLTRDQGRALQFFRWKEHALATAPRPLTPGVRLFARTDAYFRREHLLKSYYDMHEMHPETQDHLRRTQRRDILRETVRLSTSSSFSIEIMDDLTPSAPPAAERECTTYRCRMVSVDDDFTPSSAKLCVKLFNDRQAYMKSPTPEMVKEGLPFRWWTRWRRSEDSVRYEHASYTRLACLQGSVLPWYYGAHEVRAIVLPFNRIQLIFSDSSLPFLMGAWCTVSSWNSSKPLR